jgi:3-hydroxyisobutyrate dehydrogenase-like beta-hydroxyacid dehydrogenase
MSKKLAFIGLGVMGYPMAGYLSKAGHDVTIYNRTTAKAEKWTSEYDGNFAETPAKAADDAEIVFMCVGNDNDVRSVTFGNTGALAGMKDGAYLVDHTTASAELAREIDMAAKDKALHFLDAPVSGGQAGAERGQLAVMVGGEEADFAVVESIIDCYSKATTLMGPAGSGQLTKMVNQICIAGLVQGLSEGLNFATKAGLDGDKVLGVISKGAAQSWQMENRGSTMLKEEYEFGFAVDWMRKDLGICLDESQRNNARLPVTALVDQLYSHVQAKGGGRWDTSSLMKLLTND